MLGAALSASRDARPASPRRSLEGRREHDRRLHGGARAPGGVRGSDGTVVQRRDRDRRRPGDAGAAVRRVSPLRAMGAHRRAGRRAATSRPTTSPTARHEEDARADVGALPLARRDGGCSTRSIARARGERADAAVVGRDARRERRRRRDAHDAVAARAGVVLSGTGGVWRVRRDDGDDVEASLRGRLKKSNAAGAPTARCGATPSVRPRRSSSRSATTCCSSATTAATRGRSPRSCRAARSSRAARPAAGTASASSPRTSIRSSSCSPRRSPSRIRACSTAFS